MNDLDKHYHKVLNDLLDEIASVFITDAEKANELMGKLVAMDRVTALRSQMHIVKDEDDEEKSLRQTDKNGI